LERWTEAGYNNCSIFLFCLVSLVAIMVFIMIDVWIRLSCL